MAKVAPGIAIGAVIFTDGAPGPLAQVGSPIAQVGLALTMGQQALMFGCLVFWGSFHAHADFMARWE